MMFNMAGFLFQASFIRIRNSPLISKLLSFLRCFLLFRVIYHKCVLYFMESFFFPSTLGMLTYTRFLKNRFQAPNYFSLPRARNTDLKRQLSSLSARLGLSIQGWGLPPARSRDHFCLHLLCGCLLVYINPVLV